MKAQSKVEELTIHKENSTRNQSGSELVTSLFLRSKTVLALNHIAIAVCGLEWKHFIVQFHDSWIHKYAGGSGGMSTPEHHLSTFTSSLPGSQRLYARPSSPQSAQHSWSRTSSLQSLYTCDELFCPAYNALDTCEHFRLAYRMLNTYEYFHPPRNAVNCLHLYTACTGLRTGWRAALQEYVIGNEQH
jgi:hypothetical protein